MARVLKFHYFQVEMPEGAPPFQDLLSTVAGLPLARERCWERVDDALFANAIDRDNVLWRGDVIRIRMNDVPLLADLNAQTAELRLRANQGIGEETAWMFDETTRILVVQSSRIGAGPSTIAQYFARMGGHDVPVALVPVLHEEVLAQLRRLPTIRRFHVRVAGAERIVALAKDNASVRDTLKLPRTLEAPVFEFTVAMGHYKGGLRMDVKDIARSLARWFSSTKGTPDRVVVSGYDEDGQARVLDLLEARVVDSAAVPVDEGRRVTYATRRNMLDRVWGSREAGLRLVYAEPEV